MLEEKTDNLLDAVYGNLENKSIEIVQSETEVLEETETIEPTNSEIAEEITENVETVSEEEFRQRLMLLSKPKFKPLWTLKHQF